MQTVTIYKCTWGRNNANRSYHPTEVDRDIKIDRLKGEKIDNIKCSDFTVRLTQRGVVDLLNNYA